MNLTKEEIERVAGVKKATARDPILAAAKARRDVCGWTARDLARAAKASHGLVKNILCGRKKSGPVQRRIEDALRMRLWSVPEEWEARQIEKKVLE
jgi:hypothetical protein